MSEDLNIVMKASDILKKKDFEDAFREILKMILKREEQISKAVSLMQETFDNAVGKLKGDHSISLSDLKTQTNQLFVGDQLKRMDEETKSSFEKRQREMNKMIDKKLREVDDRVKRVRDGYTPIKGRDYFDGKPGKDAVISTEHQKMMEDLKEEIETLKKRPTGRMGSKKIQYTKRIDLTSSVNGSTSTFTLPKDTVSILGIESSQFPFTMSDSDFSLVGNTLVLGSGVPMLQAGQTLVCLVEVLFYG